MYLYFIINYLIYWPEHFAWINSLLIYTTHCKRWKRKKIWFFFLSILKLPISLSFSAEERCTYFFPQQWSTTLFLSLNFHLFVHLCGLLDFIEYSELQKGLTPCCDHPTNNGGLNYIFCLKYQSGETNQACRRAFRCRLIISPAGLRTERAMLSEGIYQ